MTAANKVSPQKTQYNRKKKECWESCSNACWKTKKNLFFISVPEICNTRFYSEVSESTRQNLFGNFWKMTWKE
jgi:hypothetical protein